MPLTNSVYTLAQATYFIALWHFGSEVVLFRTIRVNRASLAPLIVASECRLGLADRSHEHHLDQQPAIVLHPMTIYERKL